MAVLKAMCLSHSLKFGFLVFEAGAFAFLGFSHLRY